MQRPLAHEPGSWHRDAPADVGARLALVIALAGAAAWLAGGSRRTSLPGAEVRSAERVYLAASSVAPAPGLSQETPDVAVGVGLPAVGLASRRCESTGSPPNITKDLWIYDWCHSGSGLQSVTFWPTDNQTENFTVRSGSVTWVRWPFAIQKLSWTCDGEESVYRTSLPKRLKSGRWLSLQLLQRKKAGLPGCLLPPFGSGPCPTGRLKWNTWNATDYVSSVPFTSGTEGYSCFKIPSLLRTASGALLAFSEARKGSCGDFDPTELVYKRSTDGGATWGPLARLVGPEGDPAQLGVCGHSLVIGNAAPVQLGPSSRRHPGRILVPHTRNNFKVWITYSDDDGETWSQDAEISNVTLTDPEPDCSRNMSYFGLPGVDELRLDSLENLSKWVGLLCSQWASPYSNSNWTQKLAGPWQFVGVGTPGSVQLRDGRVLVPAYHSYIRGLDGDGDSGTLPVSQLYNNFALGHVMLSDDDGDTWRLGWTGSPPGQGANENQMVQLPNGSVLTNARSLSTGSPQLRLQARSDDRGETFGPSYLVPDLPEPFNGCQGSTVSGNGETVYVASPDPPRSSSLLQRLADLAGCRSVNATGRSHVTVWKSSDGGSSYPRKRVLDAGPSAQTSLQYGHGGLSVLYEQADPPPDSVGQEIVQALVRDLTVLRPDRLVFRGVGDV